MELVPILRVKHRKFLRAKEQRALFEQLNKTPSLLHREFGSNSKSKARIELIVLDDKTELLFVENQPWLIRGPELLLPALQALLKQFVSLPEVVVDMGAVPHIANGADVMAPGIVEMEPTLVKGDLVVIIDKKNRTPLAVGQMQIDAGEVQREGKGRTIKTLHYVGDSLWKLMKSLSE
jgi:PUA domain protein